MIDSPHASVDSDFVSDCGHDDSHVVLHPVPVHEDKDGCLSPIEHPPVIQISPSDRSSREGQQFIAHPVMSVGATIPLPSAIDDGTPLLNVDNLPMSDHNFLTDVQDHLLTGSGLADHDDGMLVIDNDLHVRDDLHPDPVDGIDDSHFACDRLASLARTGDDRPPPAPPVHDDFMLLTCLRPPRQPPYQPSNHDSNDHHGNRLDFTPIVPPDRLLQSPRHHFPSLPG